MDGEELGDDSRCLTSPISKSSGINKSDASSKGTCDFDGDVSPDVGVWGLTRRIPSFIIHFGQ